MSVVYLTAGAAGMFCGSCMHDNAVAKELIARGRECLLVPIYTPIRTDEEDQSLDQVFFGGINVYLQQKMPWIAYLPRWVDHLLNRPNLIRWLTKGAMKTDPKLLGALTVSMLRGMDGNQRKEVIRMCDWMSNDIHPKTILLTNMLIAGCLPEVKRRTGATILATLQGDDIFLESLPPPFQQQAMEAIQRLVPYVDGFIAHSREYGERMANLFKIPSDRLHVVPLGIDIRDFLESTTSLEVNSKAEDQDTAFRIGYLARMAPEKGLHLIVDAFIQLRQTRPELKARLELAGWMGPQHAEYWESQKGKLEQAGLHDQYHYWGSVDRKDKVRFLSTIDLLCVPTVYREPKGLFVLEGLASGVPYLLPAHGAFPEMHERLRSGELFAPEDVGAVADALARSVERGRLTVEERANLQTKAEGLVSISSHVDRLMPLL